jgi:hypothetical protein
LPHESFEHALQQLGQPAQHVSPQHPFGQQASLAQQLEHELLAAAVGLVWDISGTTAKNAMAMAFNMTCSFRLNDRLRRSTRCAR